MQCVYYGTGTEHLYIIHTESVCVRQKLSLQDQHNFCTAVLFTVNISSIKV